MQLRTNRKLKSTKLDDLGFEEKPIKSHKKTYKPKISYDKDHSYDDVTHLIFIIKKNFYSFYRIQILQKKTKLEYSIL